MRVATSTLYQQGLASMNDQQGALYSIQQQLATGRRVLTPSADPVAATRALTTSQEAATNTQYAASRQQANIRLSTEDKTLSAVTDVINAVHTLMVQAGNGTMSDLDRASIATALQGRYDELAGLANADDGNGNFIFAGLQTGTAPFARSPAGGMQYLGDTGAQLLQVDVARQMPAGDDGRSVFQSVAPGAGYVLQGNAGNTGTGAYGSITTTDPTDPAFGHSFTISFQGAPGAMQYVVTDQGTTPPTAAAPAAYTPGAAIQLAGATFTVTGDPSAGDTFSMKPAVQAGADMFTNLKTVIDALRQPLGVPGASTNLQNVLSTGLRQFANALDNVATVQASVGSRMNELDALDTIGTNRGLNYAQQLSDLQDLNFAQAMTDYYQRQTALQAAQQSFMQIQGMNLFRFLS